MGQASPQDAPDASDGQDQAEGKRCGVQLLCQDHDQQIHPDRRKVNSSNHQYHKSQKWLRRQPEKALFDISP